MSIDQKIRISVDKLYLWIRIVDEKFKEEKDTNRRKKLKCKKKLLEKILNKSINQLIDEELK